MAGRPKGTPKTGGRQKGIENKKTVVLRELILEALDEVGGKDYLKTQAENRPGPFLTLLGKLLPLEHKNNPDRRSTLLTWLR